jgi:hypothetical protein
LRIPEEFKRVVPEELNIILSEFQKNLLLKYIA